MSLAIHNLAFRYAGRTIFDDFGFDMAAGEQSLLIGASGSGKSTLVNLIC